MNEEKNVPAGNRSEQLAWLEMGVLTIAYPVVGFAIDRSNPFLIGYDFPWIAIPPVLIGLRHGFVRMAAGAATILAAMWLAARLAPETLPGYLPDSTMVGTLALGTLAGLFSDRHRQGPRVGRRAGDASQVGSTSEPE